VTSAIQATLTTNSQNWTTNVGPVTDLFPEFNTFQAHNDKKTIIYWSQMAAHAI